MNVFSSLGYIDMEKIKLDLKRNVMFLMTPLVCNHCICHFERHLWQMRIGNNKTMIVFGLAEANTVLIQEQFKGFCVCSRKFVEYFADLCGGLIYLMTICRPFKGVFAFYLVVPIHWLT